MDTAVAPDGRVVVVDWNNHKIRAADLTGGRGMQTLVGEGSLGDGPAGPALEARLNHPTSSAFDAEGNMLIAAWHNSRITLVDNLGLPDSMLSVLAGTGGRNYAGDGGAASAAVVDLPSSLVLDDQGRIVFVDQANQVIRRFAPGGTMELVGGVCTTGTKATPTGCDDGVELVACPAPSGRRHCANEEAQVACGRPCQIGFAEGDAATFRMAQPFGQQADPAGRLVLDDEGGILFADAGNHRIRRIAPDGSMTTIAGDREDAEGKPMKGYEGDGGPAVDALLNHPIDLARASDGTLYFTDTYNSCVRKIDTAGVISTVAGVCGERGMDGENKLATESRLDRPYGLDLDEANGILYITDTFNHRIRALYLR
jgi:DNA-binding beta-propeller fold protein YncE